MHARNKGHIEKSIIRIPTSFPFKTFVGVIFLIGFAAAYTKWQIHAVESTLAKHDDTLSLIYEMSCDNCVRTRGHETCSKWCSPRVVFKAGAFHPVSGR